MADKAVGLTLLVVFFFKGVSAEYCNSYDNGVVDCPGDCCGSDYHRYCCELRIDMAIVFIVIGCLVFVGLVVSCIVCICCCCRKSPGRAGLVVGQGGITTIMTTTSQNNAGYTPQLAYTMNQHIGQPMYNQEQPGNNPAQQECGQRHTLYPPTTQSPPTYAASPPPYDGTQ